MLAGRVWWNGLGSYALVASVQDRTIDWSNSILEPRTCARHDDFRSCFRIANWVYFGMATQSRSSIGIVIVVTWCIVVALLSSHWLYASTFASMALAINSEPTNGE